VLKHLPPRQPDALLLGDHAIAHHGADARAPAPAATINLERKAAPAVGITQAVYPVAQDVKSSLLLELVKRGEMKSALVFTRTKHRANRLADFLTRHNVPCERIHGNRSQAQRTAALAGFKSGRFRLLVATDIAARGIDVEALSHVINFDVPAVPRTISTASGAQLARSSRGTPSPSSRRRRKATSRPSSARWASACRA